MITFTCILHSNHPKNVIFLPSKWVENFKKLITNYLFPKFLCNHHPMEGRTNVHQRTNATTQSNTLVIVQRCRLTAIIRSIVIIITIMIAYQTKESNIIIYISFHNYFRAAKTRLVQFTLYNKGPILLYEHNSVSLFRFVASSRFLN